MFKADRVAFRGVWFSHMKSKCRESAWVGLKRFFSPFWHDAGLFRHIECYKAAISYKVRLEGFLKQIDSQCSSASGGSVVVALRDMFILKKAC